MGEFLHKYNTDNVHSRAVIVGFVNLLNSKVFFDNILSDTSIDTVYVPFFYNMGGDERFLQDYFLEWNDCINPRHADGNYDVIPRGIVTMTSKTIDTAKMTHRFVRGNYVKEVNGQLQTFSAYLNSLPITMQFEVEVEVDSNLDAFKVEQAIMETFYKVQVFSVSFRGLRIPCQAGFSEDYAVDKTFEFSYQANLKTAVKFSVTIETYFPVFDSSTERSNSNRVSGFNQQDTSNERYTTPRFTIETPISQEKYFSGGTMPITWTNSGPIQRVNIFYRLAGSQTWRQIAKNLNNNGSFDWKVPFFDSNGIEIPFEPQRASVITTSGRDSYVRPIIDGLGQLNQIVVLNAGFSYSANDPIVVTPFPEPPAVPASVTQPEIQAIINSGDVVGANIISTGTGFTPSPVTDIEFKIEDANTELTFGFLLNSISFVGDTDNTLPAPGNYQITNIMPTVVDLLQISSLIGIDISGAGIQEGSKIVQINILNNLIVINKTVTGQYTGATVNLTPTIGKIEIQ